MNAICQCNLVQNSTKPFYKEKVLFSHTAPNCMGNGFFFLKASFQRFLVRLIFFSYAPRWDIYIYIGTLVMFHSFENKFLPGVCVLSLPSIAKSFHTVQVG